MWAVIYPIKDPSIERQFNCTKLSAIGAQTKNRKQIHHFYHPQHTQNISLFDLYVKWQNLNRHLPAHCYVIFKNSKEEGKYMFQLSHRGVGQEQEDGRKSKFWLWRFLYLPFIFLYYQYVTIIAVHKDWFNSVSVIIYVSACNHFSEF